MKKVLATQNAIAMKLYGLSNPDAFFVEIDTGTLVFVSLRPAFPYD